jgi:serine/threonine-protein kinase
MDPDGDAVEDAGAAPEVVAGRYELGPVLGRGGMGEVRAARDLTLGRDVAVKLLHHGLAGDERVSRRFDHEARAAAKLTHPNVVRVYDAGEHRGRPFIVMERLDGGTLADEIARGPLSETRVRVVGVQVLEALAAAHKQGVLHRDVKPSNVMIAPDGSVRVADFGIAKSEFATEGTTTGTVVGTLGYLPPERLQGEAASAASDCYAVGVLLYEALSGRRPFVGDNPVAILAQVQRGDPPSLRSLRPDVDGSLPAAIRRAMAVEPHERFSSASAFADALRNPAGASTGAVTAGPERPRPQATQVYPTPPAPRPVSDRAPAVAPPRAPARYAPSDAPARQRARPGRAVMLLLVLAVVGAAVGAGIGWLLRGDDEPAPATSATLTSEAPATGDVDGAVRQLEAAVAP